MLPLHARPSLRRHQRSALLVLSPRLTTPTSSRGTCPTSAPPNPACVSFCSSEPTTPYCREIDELVISMHSCVTTLHHICIWNWDTMPSINTANAISCWVAASDFLHQASNIALQNILPHCFVQISSINPAGNTRGAGFCFLAVISFLIPNLRYLGKCLEIYIPM